jgi:hypothetical protein
MVGNRSRIWRVFAIIYLYVCMQDLYRGPGANIANQERGWRDEEDDDSE